MGMVSIGNYKHKKRKKTTRIKFKQSIFYSLSDVTKMMKELYPKKDK